MNQLVVIHDENGRPCAWGLSIDPAAARTEAERQWASYLKMNSGTKRGTLHVHVVEDNPRPKRRTKR